MTDLEEAACETFQWDITDWRSLDKRVTGPEFEIGGYKWQVSGGGVLGFSVQLWDKRHSFRSAVMACSPCCIV